MVILADVRGKPRLREQEQDLDLAVYFASLEVVAVILLGNFPDVELVYSSSTSNRVIYYEKAANLQVIIYVEI